MYAHFLRKLAYLNSTALRAGARSHGLTDVTCSAGGVTTVLNPTPATEPQRAAASAAAARAAGVTSTSAPAQASAPAPATAASTATPAGIIPARMCDAHTL